MTGADIQQPAAQVSPYMHVQPGPITATVRTMNGLVVLEVMHATGGNVYPLDRDMARHVANALLKEAGGLEVPAAGLVVPR